MNQLALFEMPIERGPVEPIVRDAHFEGNCRYCLKRAWGGGPCILWCGTNPSIADKRIDDPTIKREMRFSFLWGFGSMIKVNMYPFISPDMAELRAWLSRGKSSISIERAIQKNFELIAEYIRACDLHMAAWGNSVEPEDLREFLKNADMGVLDPEEFINNPSYEPPSVQWHCLATNNDGSPRHTLARGRLRIPDTAKPILWRAA